LIPSLITSAAPAFLHFDALGISPIALDLGILQIRWYSLAYIAGIMVGWWYLLRLLDQPGAPMARRHADDLVFYATLGILIGGRTAYVLFYKPELLLHPLDALKLWEGGMSFHGGVIGVTLAILYLARKNGLNWLRVHDYVACCVPFGLFFGRIANFINGELWGRETTVGDRLSPRRRSAAPPQPALRGRAGGDRIVPRPGLPVLADGRPLSARQARRHLPARLRAQPVQPGVCARAGCRAGASRLGADDGADADRADAGRRNLPDRHRQGPPPAHPPRHSRRASPVAS
jgi:hypothetical protein